MNQQIQYTRGSEWRLWDLHIHSPASFHWDGERFGDNPERNRELLDEMISALNAAEPVAFALMDYWTFDGWFKLKARLAEPGAPKLDKVVFPGIELRLAAPMEGRLNAHVIFSNKTKDQYLNNFLSQLKLELIHQPLSREGLIEYARNVNEDKLKLHGFKKTELEADATKSHLAGCTIAEINCDSYKDAITKVPNGLAVGFMPFTTYDGLTSIRRNEHYAYTLGLFESSPIFETRDADLWAAFAGVETSGNKTWIAPFQTALRNVPRLAVSGSDSHRFVGRASNNDKRGYGDFPSNKKTWIKADPTWEGLLQTLKEPAKRSHLGDVPTKLDKVRKNKTFYIDTISVHKAATSTLSERWLDGCKLPLNADLVAIIGNKGSGKSALADIIALLGHSQQKQYFSFLRKDRFRGKSGEPARQFVGNLHWLAGEPVQALLSEDPTSEKVEMVRYIPQGRFEALCNEHVSGRSDAFEKELREVIFSHIDAPQRLGALDFDQLVDQQEDTFRARLAELRKSLRTINAQIVSIEDQQNPILIRNLSEQIRLKKQQLDEHVALKPVEVAPPTDQLNTEQQAASLRLGQIEEELKALDLAKKALVDQRQSSAKKLRAVKNIQSRLALIESQIATALEQLKEDFALAELEPSAVVKFEINRAPLDSAAAVTSDAELAQALQATKLDASIATLQTEKGALSSQLNEPQRAYQAWVTTLREWQTAHDLILGSASEPESTKGLEARLSQIQELPILLAKRQRERAVFMLRIFKVLAEQREARAILFAPVQELIQQNVLIRDDYKLQFQAKLQSSAEAIAANLFSLVKQASGELRGEDESLAAIRSRFEKYGFHGAKDVLRFTREMATLLAEARPRVTPEVPGLRGLMRKDKDPAAVYDYLYGLEYLEPKYTLLFQDTQIEQLSPGQRGALLLIFYLLVDKSRNPIVLDQPEENLDNETVVSLLVPVLNEAKKSRQIIMVTHNPNLAVVCDAEQIIHAAFDRKNGSQILYRSGSIENPDINKAVVDVLEGTKKAFNNRGQKYH